MHTLTKSEISLIDGGGNADSGYEGGGRDNISQGGAPNSCGNQVGMGIITGAIGGIFLGGNPVSVGVGAVIGGINSAVSCADNSPNRNNGGALGGNSNANSVNGQCRW